MSKAESGFGFDVARASGSAFRGETGPPPRPPVSNPTLPSDAGERGEVHIPRLLKSARAESPPHWGGLTMHIDDTGLPRSAQAAAESGKKLLDTSLGQEAAVVRTDDHTSTREAAVMDVTAARNYFAMLGEALKIGEFAEPTDPQERRERFVSLAEEKASPDYEAARYLLWSTAVEKHEERLSGNGRDIPDPVDWVARREAQAAKEREYPEEVIIIQETPEQQQHHETNAILLARRAMDAYTELPEGKARKAAFEAFAGEYLVDLWKEPDQLKTVLGVWKAQAEESRLYASGKDRIGREIKNHWQAVTADHLSAFVTMNARGGYVAGEMGDLLKSYFAGPRSREGRVDAYYTFADAAMNLTEDHEAVKRAAEIGMFVTDILPMRDQFNFDVAMAASYAQYDHEMHQKALIAKNMVLGGLARYAGLDYEAIMTHSMDALRIMMEDPNNRRQLRQANTRSINADPNAGIRFAKAKGREGRFTFMADIYSEAREGTLTDADIQTARDILDLRDTDNDPLAIRFNAQIEQRSTLMIHNKWIKDQIAQTGEGAIFMSVRFPDRNCALEIAIPASLANDRRTILNEYLALGYFDDPAIMEQIAGHEEPNYEEDFDYEGKRVFTTLRRLDAHEGERHPVENLAGIGFPEIVGEDLATRNTELATEVELKQRRFMNERGVRIPINVDALAKLGYQHIDFRKDPTDVGKTVVTLRVHNMDVNLKLDSDFRFDFEGKPVDIGSIQDSLHHVLLTLLHPILCEDSGRDQDGQETDIKGKLISRIGYLRRLNPGEHWHQRQADLMLQHEGKDLRTYSERRMRELGIAVESTYVQPKFAADSDQPPVALSIGLPDTLFAALQSA